MADLVIIHNGPIVSSRDAKASGLKRYFTGKPCPQGHVAERWVGSGCIECQRLNRNPKENYARVKAWRKLHPEKRTEEARAYRKKYPQKGRDRSLKWRHANIEKLRPLEAAAARERRKNDPEGQRRRMAKFKAKRETELTEIAGRPRPDLCEVCGEFHIRIVFDHCHAGGQFRGWLCDRCNRVLGLIKDSTVILRGLADYLEQTDGATNNRKAERSFGQDFRVSEVTKVSDTG